MEIITRQGEEIFIKVVGYDTIAECINEVVGEIDLKITTSGVNVVVRRQDEAEFGSVNLTLV